MTQSEWTTLMPSTPVESLPCRNCWVDDYIGPEPGTVALGTFERLRSKANVTRLDHNVEPSQTSMQDDHRGGTQRFRARAIQWRTTGIKALPEKEPNGDVLDSL